VYAGRSLENRFLVNTDELKQVIEEKWSLLNDRHIQKSIVKGLRTEIDS